MFALGVTYCIVCILHVVFLSYVTVWRCWREERRRKTTARL